MDNRRPDTATIISAGILDLPIPAQSCPEDAELQGVDGEIDSEETLRAGLLAGGLTASMYYGCWSIWKTGEIYSGELLQYRAVTDKFVGVDLDAALEKAQEWFDECYG